MHVCAEGIPHFAPFETDLDVSVSANDRCVLLVSACVCAEGIPSHTSSVWRFFSFRNGLRLHVQVSVSDSVVFFRCVDTRASVLKEVFRVRIMCLFYT
jgi:hypothetical protein